MNNAAEVVDVAVSPVLWSELVGSMRPALAVELGGGRVGGRRRAATTGSH